MTNLSLTVKGKPIAQPRQRMRNAGKFIQSYTPKSHPVTAWKHAIQNAYLANKDRPAFGLAPEKGEPLSVLMNFTMPRPKAHFRANGEIKDNAPYWHTTKPDTDNLAKAALDALCDVGAFHDDAQVAKLTIEKHYQTPTDREPGVNILIERLK